jgi:hypothetical protein
MVEKALASEADGVFLDLEDAVAPDDKAGARKDVVRALQELDWRAGPRSTAPTPSIPRSSTATSSRWSKKPATL